MKYERFEDLPVWRAAADVAARMFDWSARSEFRNKGDLANQLQRAALSISNNIAEGFERGTTRELLVFLYYARDPQAKYAACCVSWNAWRRLPIWDLRSPISNPRANRSRDRFEAGRIVCRTRTLRVRGT